MICPDIPGFDQEDKIDHAMVGGLIGVATLAVIDEAMPRLRPWERRVIAMVPVIVAGVGKEIYDNRHQDLHTSDWRDAATTIAAGAVSIEIVIRW